MRAVSKKRAVQLRLYAKLRVPFLEANPYCQSPWDCGQPATELHHKRGRVGADLTDDTHWAALCHDCHLYVTEHPTVAVELGVSELRIGRSA